HVAEGTGARAGVAHDHEGGVLFLPALADIGAAGLLADRNELVFADDRLGGIIALGNRRFDPDPVRLAQQRAVGPAGLFRVARLWPGNGIDDDRQNGPRTEAASST